ncbi:MAG: hypothetical protein KJ623_01220, partial [Nanoarchaeota archaeon]|nr:hypothetical protein [Nanoarchaeota archaeon]
DWGDGTSYTETPTSAILDPDGFNCKTTHIYTNPIGNHCRNPPTCSLWDYEVIFTIEDNNNSTSIDKCYVDF